MSYTKIRLEPFLGGAGLRVVLNAPKGNILDGVMMGEINAALDDFRERPELKLLCFVGEGDHFCFGAAVEEHVGERAATMLEGFHGMFRRLADLAIPTVAAVRGRCLGGGMELACFCHQVFAHPGAAFGQPEIQLAVLPPVAAVILPLRVGQARADDLIITGRVVKAPEAKELGIADHVVDDPMAAVEEWAERELGSKSASSLRFAVRAARWRYHEAVRHDLAGVERLYLDELMATHDANEGLAAFLEKRQPSWTNA